MTEHEPFLRAIIAQPDEDAPRLIYADWLEEQGLDQRAEFIRVQCELAALQAQEPVTWDLARMQGLEDREEVLLEVGEALGENPLQDVARHCHYRRGMLEEATLAMGMYLREAHRDLPLVPLRRLTLTHVEPQYLNILAETQALERLQGLTLRHEEEVHQVLELRDLFASPHLHNLESFGLRNILNSRLSNRHHHYVGPRLQELTLNLSSMLPWDVEDLFRSPMCQGLRRLHLLGSYSPRFLPSLVLLLETAGIEGLTFSGELAASMSTGLSEVDLLLASPALAQIRELRLSGSWLDEAVMQHLNWTDQLRHVTKLSLSGGGICDYGLRALARSEQLPNLQILDLRGNNLDIMALRALAGGPLLGQLSLLCLAGTHLHRQALETLLHSRYWSGRTGLLLDNVSLTRQMLRDLRAKNKKHLPYCRILRHSHGPL
jgi:uncharacterized protein (TIGR02996 family)